MSRLLNERAIAMGMALEASSRASYGSHLNSYITFCRTHHLPIAPSVDTLSFFVVYMSAYISPDSVAVYLAGICNRLEAEFPDVRQIRNHPVVKRTLRGCLRRAKRPPTRKRPLEISDLTRVGTCHNHDDLLFLTLLSTGFHGLMRLGELVWPDATALQSYRRIIMRHSLHITLDDYRFTLPTHKTLKVGHGTQIVIKSISHAFDPIAPMRRYLRSRDHLFYSAPELWLTSQGSIPTRSWFMRRFRAIFPPDFGGHSMRAGGTTTLALLGTAPALIQAVGRWTSDEWQKYVRTHPFLQQALLHGERHEHV